MSSGSGDELKKLLRNRAALKESIKNLRERLELLRRELEDTKHKLDEENTAYTALKERILQLKAERSEVLERLRDSRSRLSELKKISRGLRSSLDPEEAARLEREIEELEWDLQTKPRSEINETRIIESISKLSRALSSWRKAYKIKTEIGSLSKRLDTLDNKYFEVKTELDALLDEASTRRERIKKLLAAKKQLQSEIRGLKEDIRELEDELVKLKARIRAARLRERQEIEEKKRREEKALLAKRREEVLRKLKHNESLNWDDLKALYSDSM